MGGALDPVVAKARNLVKHHLRDLAPGAKVVAAVSGGADSLALAAALSFVAPKCGLEATAVVVDHGLQEGSDAVAAAAAESVRAIGMEAVVLPVVVGTGAGPEAAARTARYGALDQVEGIEAVLLGHTRNDQAETVLLGLARGSGPRAITGMAAINGRYRRPFLTMTRAETEQVCVASGLTWWADPHNSDPAYRRVRVRHEVMPLLETILGPGFAAALARTADLVRADCELLDALAERESGSLVVAELASMAGPIRMRVLRRAAIDAGATAAELSAHHLGKVEELVVAWRGQLVIELPGGIAVWRDGDALRFGPNPVAP